MFIYPTMLGTELYYLQGSFFSPDDTPPPARVEFLWRARWTVLAQQGIIVISLELIGT